MSITTWNRLELDVAHADPAAGLAAGLAASLADPLWLLARQLQLGELRGEDAGTPVTAHGTLVSYPVAAYATTGAPAPLPRGVPLEALIEPEADQLDLRWRARGGELLLALLAEHDLEALIARAGAAFPWAPSPDADPDGDTFLRVAASRCPDGAAVAAAIRAGQLAHDLAAAELDAPRLERVAAAWLAWWAPRVRQGATDAWVPERLEHRATLHVELPEGAATLHAVAYPGGRLDWDDFDLEIAAPGGASSGEVHAFAALPTPLDVPGMPRVRFWELEDPRFDPGRVSIGPGDLGTALVVEAALAYAADWFLLGVPAQLGALHHLARLDVVDTFGVATEVRPAARVRPDAGWALWQLSPRTGGAAAPYLFLPTATASLVQGEIIEDVLLVRDELANVGWGIERTITDALGRPARRTASTATAPSTTAAADLRYEPLPPLPDDRVPLARVEAADGPRLRRAQGVAAPMLAPPTRGRFLTPGFTVHEGEVGREGVALTRRWQCALDATGRRWIWCTRSKAPGAPQAGLRLAFDDLVGRAR